MHFPVILVSPVQRAENIGAASRTMKTMAFSELAHRRQQHLQDPASRRAGA